MRSWGRGAAVQVAKCLCDGLFCRLSCKIGASFFVEVLFLFNWVPAVGTSMRFATTGDPSPVLRFVNGDMADPRDHVPLPLMTSTCE